MGLQALITEDDPDLQWIFTEAFIHVGFEVTMAVDGNEAIQYLDSTLPDVLILDLNMPKCPGQDVIDYMRQSGQLDQVHIIVVTGDALAGRYLDPGLVDLVLIKPVDPVMLVDLARRLVISHKQMKTPPETPERTSIKKIVNESHEGVDANQKSSTTKTPSG